ncbi:hypothetical protein Golob_004694, partial [Gossypium lobatum]|nr:hypothetical protein [Gossypium lobatum]
PWSPNFSATQSEIKSKVIWIRLLGLPVGYYSNCLLRVIGQTIGLVVKLDVYTNCACRRRFTCLEMCVNLRKPLISKVRINGRLQRVEYKALPNICFKCGYSGHGTNLCLRAKMTSPKGESKCVHPIMEKSMYSPNLAWGLKPTQTE